MTEFSAPSRSSALPRTYVGRWMRASMLDQRELRAQLTDTLNGGSKVGWNDDEPAVVTAVFELMLRRCYGPEGPDSAEIAWLAGRTHQAFASDKRPVSEHDAGTIIRAAADDPSADLSPVMSGDSFRVRGAVASFLSVVRLRMDEKSVDEVLREAERLAFERGFHPPLVPRNRSGAERP